MALIAGTSLVEFFKDQVEGALVRQRVPAPQATAHYVVQLLAEVARLDGDGPAAALRDPRPLALRLAAAMDDSHPQPASALRDVADAALLLSGFFASRTNRPGVPAAYYRTLGGYAYGTLGQDGQRLSPIFADLARRFGAYAEVLGEVGLRAEMNAPAGLLRLIEYWQHSRHHVTARLLTERGVVLPPRGSAGRLQ